MDQEYITNHPEFKLLGYQYTIMYMARIHSLAEFLFTKILLLRGKVFSEYEASEVVEAFTIKSICDWEWYIERIFCECLKDDTSQLSKQLGLVLPKSITIDESMAYLNGLGYFDIKSASNLKSLAKKILTTAANPFENLHSEARNQIDNFYTLRNYVAHRSNKSKNTLNNVYQKYNQKEFIEVGMFLLGKTSDIKSTIRFQDFGSSFWLASFNIMEKLYPAIYKWIVQEEKVYNEKCHLRLEFLMSICLNKPQ